MSFDSPSLVYCSTLFGLLEQALGFIEEAGVFEGSSQRGGNGGQQTQFRYTIGVLAVVVLNANIAQETIAG